MSDPFVDDPFLAADAEVPGGFDDMKDEFNYDLDYDEMGLVNDDNQDDVNYDAFSNGGSQRAYSPPRGGKGILINIFSIILINIWYYS